MRHILFLILLVPLTALAASNSTQDATPDTVFGQVGELLVACAKGDQVACGKSDKLDRQIREMKYSKRCSERKTTSDSLICGFVDGYIAEAI